MEFHNISWKKDQFYPSWWGNKPVLVTLMPNATGMCLASTRVLWQWNPIPSLHHWETYNNIFIYSILLSFSQCLRINHSSFWDNTFIQYLSFISSILSDKKTRPSASVTRLDFCSGHQQIHLGRCSSQRRDSKIRCRRLLFVPHEISHIAFMYQ